MATKKKSTSKIPFLAMLVLMVVVGASIFLWKSANGKLAKPLNGLLLPLGLGILGVGSFFFRPVRFAATPLLLGAGAVGGVALADRLDKSGVMGAPSYHRLRVAQNRPAPGVNRPAAAINRPAAAMNGTSLKDSVATPRSAAW